MCYSMSNKHFSANIYSIKARWGSRPQISDFSDSCAEICDLSGEPIENPQFSVFSPINNESFLGGGDFYETFFLLFKHFWQKSVKFCDLR